MSTVYFGDIPGTHIEIDLVVLERLHGPQRLHLLIVAELVCWFIEDILQIFAG